MNDERAREVMVKAALFFDLDETEKHAADLVERQLAALRAEGFDLYRPDECPTVDVVDTKHADGLRSVFGPFGPEAGANEILADDDLAKGTYRLVPVGGEG